MIIFLYGPDTYRLRQKLKEIIEEYKKRHQSGVNFIKIDLPVGKAGLKENELTELEKAIKTVSMFNEKKIIVVEDIFQQPEHLQQDLLNFLREKKIDSDKGSLVIFCSEKKESKSTLFDFLKKKAKTQEFNPLLPYKIKEWIKNYVKKQGGHIENLAVEKLSNYVSNDLWRMSNELDKLIAYSKSITVQDVDRMVKADTDVDIFATIDALGRRNKKQALGLVNEHLKKGEGEDYLLNRFVYQFRNLLKVKSAFRENPNIKSINLLANKLNMHPFVVKKSIGQSKSFSFDELKKIYQKLLEIDLNMKTGKTDSRAALEMFIVNL